MGAFMFDKPPPEVLSKTLICGATGRLGMITAKKMSEAGHPVVALVRNPSCSQAAELREMENVEVVKGDLRDKESLKAAVHGCSNVVVAATVRPLRFAKFSDLWKDPLDDPTHPACLNYAGVKNMLEVRARSMACLA